MYADNILVSLLDNMSFNYGRTIELDPESVEKEKKRMHFNVFLYDTTFQEQSS